MPSIFTIKSTAITLAASLVFSAALPMATANAEGRHNNGDLIAAGVIGLALGAIIVDSSNRRQQRADHTYYDMPAYTPPQPVARYRDQYYQPYPDAGTNYDNSYRDRPAYRNNRSNYYQPDPVLSPRNHRQVYQPAPKTRHTEPKVVTYNDRSSYGVEPWSTDWYSYCRGKFRSFNAISGTYLGYDGKRHFCVVK